MEGYEKEYHLLRHNYLYTNRKYYRIRSNLALKKYFKGVDRNAKVLDFGCGLGHNISLLPNAVGYDISKFSLDFCKKRGINVIENLKNIKEGSFDVVFSAHVLEHLENPSEILKMLYSKLKDGGKLILIIPAEVNVVSSKFKLSDSQHLYGWSFRSINNLLIKNNFKILENKFLRGKGYKKLLFLSFNLKLYRGLTWLIGLTSGQKEMKIVAEK